jgi:hypothetical protein
MSYLRDSCCSICVERLDKVKKNDIRQVTEESLVTYGRYWVNFHLQIGDKICGKCRSKYKYFLNKQNKLNTKSNDNNTNDNNTNDNNTNDNNTNDNNTNDNNSNDNNTNDNNTNDNNTNDNNTNDNNTNDNNTNDNNTNDNNTNDNNTNDNNTNDNNTNDNYSHHNDSSENNTNDNNSNDNYSHHNDSSENNFQEIIINNEKNKGDSYNQVNIEGKKSSKNVEDEFISVNIPRTYASHQWCIICKRSDKKLHRVSDEIITSVFIQKNILIPYGARCCAIHFDEFYNLKTNEIDKIETVQDNIKLHSEKIEKLLNSLKNVAQNSCLFEKFRDFGKLITDDICKETTGLYKFQFEELCFYLKSLKDSDLRTKEQCVAIYLFWLKTGKFNQFLFILFLIHKNFI